MPSRAFSKFNSYGMLETAASRGWKAKDAIEWFYGIGRLVLAKLAECYSAVCRCKQNMRCALLETILQWAIPTAARHLGNANVLG